MDKIHQKFNNQFRTQWIKVKFYREKPNLKNAKRPENVRFCEATKQAIIYPVILDRENLNCPGAQYAFGWLDASSFLDYCRDKTDLPNEILPSILKKVPRFENAIESIGLNTDGEPDLILSSVMPKDMMALISLYQRNTGKTLDVSLSGMMSVCGGIAVKTFLENQLTFSFGCTDSRKYAKLGSDRMVVGVPKKLFDIFSIGN